jgi:hypothetical protein
MMRSFKPLAVALLVVVFALSSAVNVYAVTTWTATDVTVFPGGSGSSTVTAYGPNAEFFYVCVGLPFGAACQYSAGGHLDTFTNDPDTEIVTVTTSPSTPIGTYTITLHISPGSLNPPGADATFTLNVGTRVIVIEVPYSICVVQVGLVQQDGSTEWIGTGVTGAPISDCQNTTEYFTDVGGGTVAFHQFIMNGTFTIYKIVTTTTDAT